MTQQTIKQTRVWLLMGFTGSAEGVLSLSASNISLELPEKGALSKSHLKKLALLTANQSLVADFTNNKIVEIFNIPILSIRKIDFPWYGLNSAMNLFEEDNKYRISFIQPQNTVASPGHLGTIKGIVNIKEARKVGKEWKALLSKQVYKE